MSIRRIILESFLNINKCNTCSKYLCNTITVLSKFTVYSLIDWIAAGFQPVIVTLLKLYHYSDIFIFGILWFYDISIGILFIFASKKVIEDLTLMAATRRTINLLYKEKQNIGFMLGAIIIIKCCIWDGAERFVIFFENELTGNARKLLTITIVSGIQMATWTKLYSFLYDACYSIFMNA